MLWAPARGAGMEIRSTRHWTDWVGLTVFTAIGVNLYSQAPEFGLLILPAILQELFVAASFLLRPRVRIGVPGWRPRLVAYANAFGVMLFLSYAARYRHDWIRPTPVPELRAAGSATLAGRRAAEPVAALVPPPQLQRGAGGARPGDDRALSLGAASRSTRCTCWSTSEFCCGT